MDAYTGDRTFELDGSAMVDVCTEGGPIGRYDLSWLAPYKRLNDCNGRFHYSRRLYNEILCNLISCFISS